MSIKLIALDLDGTLLTTDKRITARTRAAIEECEKRGIEIVPATGRAMRAVPAEILELPGVRYGIFTNGASVWDIREEKSIAAQYIDWQTALKAIEILERYPMLYDLYIEGRGICEAQFLERLEEFGVPPENCRIIRSSRQPVPNLIAYLKEFHPPVQKINLIFREKAVKAEVRRELSQIDALSVTSSLPWNLEVNAQGATKGGGLERLRAHLNISREETMAFGDGENDLPMLQAAGLGIAMENGADFLKKQADIITLTNDRDGVAAAIEQYALGE
ncbi:Cof-type HAD-IIB family hydrolase [Otoolea muris]|uniref:Cof-type HAD-IIB family hydrolase n=1 Tax=Otoolea muris TaxID=2941515 RepID=UPI00203A3F89|nr:Cof-type HAD-IIB family hydrolase [Otoolea muris]